MCLGWPCRVGASVKDAIRFSGGIKLLDRLGDGLQEGAMALHFGWFTSTIRGVMFCCFVARKASDAHRASLPPSVSVALDSFFSLARKETQSVKVGDIGLVPVSSLEISGPATRAKKAAILGTESEWVRSTVAWAPGHSLAPGFYCG